ncbi:chorismate mutase [Rhodococcus sp. DT1]|uniref:chorismate mutase n=1 Tax=unclassified Rhodococcus (in: high G+C Gram-positive bacteria) TaxID=192944 RepID=UPI003CECA8E6
MNDRQTAADTTTAPTPETELDALRTELDRVDRALLDDVRDRLALCARVAELKRRHNIAVLQPDRMQTVHRRAQDYAHRNGLSGDFVEALYTLLIGEACRLEDDIVAAAGADAGPRPALSGDPQI